MDKEHMRRQLMQKRLGLSARDVQSKSQNISQSIQELINWANVKTVHCFSPIAENNEVNTEYLIEHINNQYPKVRIFTSRKVNGIWKNGELLQRGFVVTENLPAFDIIFIPLLGFDSKLNRLGYGGGYYDRFLTTQPTAKKIGLCFELGKVGAVPTEVHDIPLDLVVTEAGAVSVDQ
jgi:5-formyltetrahydrofolate cyclo-ligase